MITPFSIMQQLVGTRELIGDKDNPLILAMIATCNFSGESHDEVPWCSAGLNFVAKLANCPRSKSLSAKSWLGVGQVINLDDAVVGYDIIIFNRGSNKALGHVGLFAGFDHHTDEPNSSVVILGANQGNAISLQHFPVGDVVGVRRLI